MRQASFTGKYCGQGCCISSQIITCASSAIALLAFFFSEHFGYANVCSHALPSDPLPCPPPLIDFLPHRGAPQLTFSMRGMQKILRRHIARIDQKRPANNLAPCQEAAPRKGTPQISPRVGTPIRQKFTIASAGGIDSLATDQEARRPP